MEAPQQLEVLPIGTRVRIHPGRAKNTGRIVIDFYSLDDFDRISGDLGLSVDS